VTDTATGLTEAVAVVTGQTAVQGTVSGSTVNFSSLTLPAGAFTVTISNVRIDASKFPLASGVPQSIGAQAFISGSQGSILPAVISQPQVAFVQPGLGTTSTFKAVDAVTPGTYPNLNASTATTAVGANSFVNCVKQTPGLAGLYQINEGFAQAFKSATNEGNQVTTTPVANAAISTRVKLSFANVPTGVTVLLPVGVINSRAGNATLQWVTSDTGTGTATADTNANGGAIAASARAVALTGGAGSVTFRIILDDPNALDKFNIPVYVVTAANGVTANAAPFTITTSFAPAGNATSIPNFVSGASSVATNMSAFSQCSTSLLFPFVTNQLGFDTGIAIANTSTDPFTGTDPAGNPKGAVSQAGTCSLNFYGTGAPSPANVTTPNVESGKVYTQVLSGVAAGFQGYMIAQCNFQFAHGFAFVTNGVGANGGLSQGYLAGVIPDVNQKGRAADPAVAAAAGTGETLGN